MGFINYVTLFVVPLLALVGRLMWKLDIGKGVPKDQDHCRILPGTETLPGAEDIAHWKGGVFLVSSGDLRSVFQEAHTEKDTGVYFADIHGFAFGEEKSAKIGKLSPIGYPAKRELRPHGMTFSNTTSTLYVINHFPLPESESCVELFQVSEAAGDPRTPELTWMRSVCSNFKFVGLNNIVEGSKEGGEFYVSRWLTKGMAKHGTEHKETLDDYLGFVESVTNMGFGYPADSTVLRCTFDPKDQQGNVDCQVAASGFPQANGVAINEDRSRVFVSDTLSRQVLVYERDLKTGLLSLIQTVQLAGSVDNVQYVQDTNELYVATFSSTVMNVLWMLSKDKIEVPGVELSFKIDENGKLGESKQLCAFDGSFSSFVTVADRYGPYNVFGTIDSNQGLSVCGY